MFSRGFTFKVVILFDWPHPKANEPSERWSLGYSWTEQKWPISFPRVLMRKWTQYIRTVYRYLNCCTRLFTMSLSCNFHFGLLLLLTAIHLIFFQLMFRPFISLYFLTFRRNYSFLSATNTMSFAYLKLLRLRPSIIKPGRTSSSPRMASLYKFKKRF